ncbi:unnamed protein product [Gulo gulo]|uniref:Uncharacterized protein n=1 Tax=Gulo gulo TaxID=48420 RepID=A0A9X9M9C5_GULGU|nr:unnamed protein product [Gulo gulo]
MSHLLGVPGTAWEAVGHLALVLTLGVLSVPCVSHAPLLTAGPQLSWDKWTRNMHVAPACCLGNPFVRPRTLPLETACSPWCVRRPCHPERPQPRGRGTMGPSSTSGEGPGGGQADGVLLPWTGPGLLRALPCTQVFLALKKGGRALGEGSGGWGSGAGLGHH